MADKTIQPYSDKNWLNQARTGVAAREANGGSLVSVLRQSASTLKDRAGETLRAGIKEGARGVIATSVFQAAGVDAPILASAGAKAASLSTAALKRALAPSVSRTPQTRSLGALGI